MYASIETRWFLEPRAKEIQLIEDWFAKYPEWVEKEPAPRKGAPPVSFAKPGDKKEGGNGVRTDYYLMMDGYPKLSFKIREGKTEVKVLDKDFGLERFTTICSGRVEKWIKWGPDLLIKKAIPKDVFREPDAFVAVPKERLLIKFLIDENNEPHRVDPGRKDLDNGCQVELTRLQYKGRDLVSFGFESLGEDKRLLSSFKIICKKTLSEMPKVRLTTRQSFSYPALFAK